MDKGVSLNDFADALRVFQGSLYVNDFNLFGRTWEVIIQAAAEFRDEIEDHSSIARAQQQGRNGAARFAGEHQGSERPAGDDAVQQLHGGDGVRRRRTRRQFG